MIKYYNYDASVGVAVVLAAVGVSVFARVQRGDDADGGVRGPGRVHVWVRAGAAQGERRGMVGI